jgi:hypothetical protein
MLIRALFFLSRGALFFRFRGRAKNELNFSRMELLLRLCALPCATIRRRQLRGGFLAKLGERKIA